MTIFHFITLGGLITAGLFGVASQLNAIANAMNRANELKEAEISASVDQPSAGK